jgi:NTP pyrophosphatase (non-canonical NTP hydrolase)
MDRSLNVCKACHGHLRDLLDRPKRCFCSYTDEVKRTAGISDMEFAKGAMGLAGEAGEVVDELKKHLYHGKTLNRESLIKELGDVRWYLEYLALMLNVSMEEIETQNVLKLRARYPHGFEKIGDPQHG